MTAEMICRKLSGSGSEIRYAVVDAHSFTQYAVIEYSVDDGFTAKINSPDSKQVIVNQKSFLTFDGCLTWIKSNIRRDDYRHTPWW